MPELIFGNVLGGVNYQTPPTELPKYFLADAQNIVPNMTGYVTKRAGSSALNSNAYGSLITSFHELVASSTSYKFAAQGTVIGLYDSSAGDFSDHITGLTSGAYGQWWNYGDYAIYVNGSDNPQKTDGTAGSDLTADQGGLAGGTCIAEWGERVWIPIGATLYGSALRAETDFSTSTTDTGYWEGTIGNRNEDIRGLFPFFDQLLIGKLNQIYVLTGAPETASSTFRLAPLYSKNNDSIGFTSKNALTQVGNDLLFLDGLDIKRLSGITQYGDVESISVIGNIKDYFKSSSGAALDRDYLQNANFFHYKHREQVWCSIPTGASTRFWLIIDYSNRELKAQLNLPMYSIFPMAGLTPISFGGVQNGARVDIYAGCEDGFVRQLDTGTNDTSTAIDAHCTWGFGHPSRRMQPVHIGLNIKYDTTCTISPSYAVGLNSWEGTINSSNFTALDDESLTESDWVYNDDVSIVSKKLSGLQFKSGRNFLFKLRHNTAGETFELRPSYFHYRLKQRYGW